MCVRRVLLFLDLGQGRHRIRHDTASQSSLRVQLRALAQLYQSGSTRRFLI